MTDTQAQGLLDAALNAIRLLRTGIRQGVVPDTLPVRRAIADLHEAADAALGRREDAPCPEQQS
jgi:hypothetical protein